MALAVDRSSLRVVFMFVAADVSPLGTLVTLADAKKLLASNESSPIQYNSPKPQEIVEEDKIVSTWKLDIQPEAVTIVPVGKVFE